MDENSAEQEILQELTLINQEEKEKRYKQKLENPGNPQLPNLHGKIKLFEKKSDQTAPSSSTENKSIADK